MEYSSFRAIGKYTFYIIECVRPCTLNMLTNFFLDTPDYLHSADSLKEDF